MRSIDNFRLMQRILRKVNLFSCLNMEQIRKIVCLLMEEKFLAGEYLSQEGERSENFYIIVKGECECIKSVERYQQDEKENEVERKVEGEDEAHRDANHEGRGQVQLQNLDEDKSKMQEGLCDERLPSGAQIASRGRPGILKQNDHFGEQSLLSSSSVADASVIAKTDVKVLFVGRNDFERHLGRFADKVESYKAVRDADILSRVDAPSSFEDVSMIGLISLDNVGSILLGSFGFLPSLVTVRSYLYNEVHRHKASAAALNSLEAFRAINDSTQKNYYVFRLLSVCHTANALHLIIDVPVVADLDSLLMARGLNNSLQTSEEVVIYVATCVFSALEFLHSLGIIYRAIQPEAMYVDLYGRVLLGGFRVSKVGTVGGKTYTIAGTTDYLAPEQIGRQGHSASVDLWSLGIVLYELATGVHPFTEEGDTELIIKSKISSYGTRAFPKLIYPEPISRELVALIDRLLVPVPEMRLGAGLRGYDAVKELFNNLDWDKICVTPPASPLASYANSVKEDMLLIGVEPSILDTFSEEYTGDQWATSIHL